MRQETQFTLDAIIRAVLELPTDAIVADVRQEATDGWDSLAHAVMVGAIESEFNLQIDAADSLELVSYEAIESFLTGRGL
jgi:acyl carrier protein